jgi:AmiR/NasT family two-component response regulator
MTIRRPAVIEPDPSNAGAARDRINHALGVLAERREVTFSEALHLLLAWANECAMSMADVADLVLAEARLGAEDPDD